MARKFVELTPSEQLHFNNLASFTKEAWDERIDIKLDIVRRFDLDLNEPVVVDFLTNVYAPQAQPHYQTDKLDLKEQTVMVQEQLPSVTLPVQQVEKSKKREMTYANSEDLIIIQNRLLHAISHLTLNERRLILFLSPIVRKQIEQTPNNRVFYVHVQDFVNEYGIKSKKYYGELEKIADSIVEKAFFFWYQTQNGKAKKGVSWVSECDYIENEAKIKIKLDDTVIEMLTVFDKTTGNFWTQYQKEWIINLGTYGIVMLEMILSSKESSGYYTTEHLREKFNCVDTYPRFSDFKLYVIDKSIKEVHKHTPIRIEYQQHKVGRVVTGLTFSYIDTSIKIVRDKTKNSDDKPKENNPFVNFKMTPKQLAVFGAKIAKKIDKDIEIVIDEMSNVHLQGQYVEYLKLLDFVPSDWYGDDEVKDHPTAEKIAQDKLKAEQEIKRQAELEQARLKKDYEILLANAEEFVLANQKMVSSGIGKTYLKEKNYQQIVMLWEMRLLDKESRADFKMVDELLARDVP